MSENDAKAEENPTLAAIEKAVKTLAERVRRTDVKPAPGDGELPGLYAVSAQDAAHFRMLEALLFAAAEPLDMETIRARMPGNADCSALLARLEQDYAERGVNLVRIAGGYWLQTAPDLAHILVEERSEPRKLSPAALETLAIIAYHQPVTRAEIEDVRGVAVSKGTLDLLMEMKWVRLRGRRRTPGRPVTYGTTNAFLEHFSLDRINDLPGKDELQAAGLLDSRIPPGFSVPVPDDGLDPGDLPLEDDEGTEGAFHTDYLGDEDEQ